MYCIILSFICEAQLCEAQPSQVNLLY